ncbi:dickkopf-related protein 4-like [Lethenteron reissneri]|uniref:dickkopf-related protein 4-like n=1 Tax=Lethenteron reissneri TaxID=7753 RepID=UPI002AB655F5|nr:dickkopf-related protein 4-like [Lethenteron reissneri]
MAVFLALCLCALWARALAGGPPHPNAIKGPGTQDGGAASLRPGTFPGQQQAKNHAADETYGVECARDVDCSRDMFCGGMRLGSHVCVACRRVGKRCHRHQMCCLGSHCQQGTCIVMTTESSEEEEVKSLEPSQLPPSATVNIHKAEEGSACLRSSECAAGLCCARHLWSRVCKRVRALGEACSRRARPKGSRGLELFERCDCGPGLSCRPTRALPPAGGAPEKDARRGGRSRGAAATVGGHDKAHVATGHAVDGGAGGSHPTRLLHVCQAV